MIGIILTGHGSFSSGLYSSVKLIAGAKEEFICCDFIEGASAEELQENLRKAAGQLKEKCEGIIFFTDLKGGSPFQKAVTVAYGQSDMEVIAGSNLPMILEVVMAREHIDDLKQLAETAVNTGKEQIYRFAKAAPKAVKESEGGI